MIDGGETGWTYVAEGDAYRLCVLIPVSIPIIAVECSKVEYQ